MNYIGNKVWFDNLNASSSFGHGVVKDQYYHENKLYLVFECEINGGLRVAGEKDIVNKPCKRMQNKYFQAQKERNEVLKKR